MYCWFFQFEDDRTTEFLSLIWIWKAEACLFSSFIYFQFHIFHCLWAILFVFVRKLNRVSCINTKYFIFYTIIDNRNVREEEKSSEQTSSRRCSGILVQCLNFKHRVCWTLYAHKVHIVIWSSRNQNVVNIGKKRRRQLSVYRLNEIMIDYSSSCKMLISTKSNLCTQFFSVCVCVCDIVSCQKCYNYFSNHQYEFFCQLVLMQKYATRRSKKALTFA